MLVIGLCVMLYPTFSNWWNARVQSRAIANYDKAVSELNDTEIQRYLDEARKYNEELSKLASPFSEYNNIKGYKRILDITGTGIMGYITIPKINVYLPIYHGTDPEVLNIAVGHMQGSYLPIGGIGTRSVISAHRGLPSAKLFTDIDQLIEGDTFTITILDEILTYEVCNIQVILPTETDKLYAEPDKDLVTLMTCTPYGINTHRLLVTASRIDNVEERTVRIPADAYEEDRFTIMAVLFAILFVILLMYWFITGRHRKHRRIDSSVISDLPRK